MRGIGRVVRVVTARTAAGPRFALGRGDVGERGGVGVARDWHHRATLVGTHAGSNIERPNLAPRRCLNTGADGSEPAIEPGYMSLLLSNSSKRQVSFSSLSLSLSLSRPRNPSPPHNTPSVSPRLLSLSSLPPTQRACARPTSTSLFFLGGGGCDLQPNPLPSQHQPFRMCIATFTLPERSEDVTHPWPPAQTP